MFYFLKRFALLNAPEATVLSFLAMSLIGGSLLWYTESDRSVTVKTPYLNEVTVTPAPTADGVLTEPRVEVHTFTRDTVQQGESFVDTLFTAVSALCVTGLTSTDFAAWSLSGQIITMILIQMGGLGIILFTSIFAYLIARGIPERTVMRSLLAGILDTDHDSVERMFKHVIAYTFAFEGAAFVIMGVHLQFFADPALLNGVNPWWWSLFHSVSAFNNAGFSLMSNNLMNFVRDPIINHTIASLIILGGLGYPVLVAAHAGIRNTLLRRSDREQHNLLEDIRSFVASPVQVRVAVIGTFLLLFVGTVFALAVDFHNPAFEGLTPSQRVMAAYFQSVSTRTAGFNTVDIGLLSAATLFLYMALMYIGANPAGTAGGIKIPTVAVLYGYIKDWFKKPGEPVTLHGRRVSKFAVSHAVRLYFFSTMGIALAAIAICIAEAKFLITPDPTFNFLKVIFEIFSAFGTVGLSMGFPGAVTSFSAILTPFSKLMIILMMLFGRLGPLTILASLPWKRTFADHPLSPDFADTDKIQIG